MTTPENVNTWRGLADELNPEQIARLEEWERPRPVMPRGDTPGDLLAWARGYATQNLADALGLTAARRNSMVRALCCQCGDLRIVSGSHIRRDGNRTVDDGCDARGWRMTGTVKCSVCRAERLMLCYEMTHQTVGTALSLEVMGTVRASLRVLSTVRPVTTPR